MHELIRCWSRQLVFQLKLPVKVGASHEPLALLGKRAANPVLLLGDLLGHRAGGCACP